MFVVHMFSYLADQSPIQCEIICANYLCTHILVFSALFFKAERYVAIQVLTGVDTKLPIMQRVSELIQTSGQQAYCARTSPIPVDSPTATTYV